MDYQSLEKKIRNSFPVTPLPPMSIHQGRLADYSISREIAKKEWNEAGMLDRDVRWDQVSEATIVECQPALSHLDEVSFIYYLPAFLLYAAKHIDADLPTGAGEVVSSAVFSVTHRSNHSVSRYKRLNDSQIDAVIAFLHFVADAGNRESPDAQKALKRYWENPEARG
jgi:hypothetical protein